MTKTIEAALDEFHDIEAFKKKVVKVALKAADRHGWCDEIKNILSEDLGLAEFLPPEHVVQQLPTARNRRWVDIDSFGDNERDKKDAIETAVESRAWSLRPVRGYRNANTVPLTLNISANSDPAELKAQIDRLHNEVKARVKAEAEWTPPAYPKYRVIERRGKEETVVHEVNDDEALAYAKKMRLW